MSRTINDHIINPCNDKIRIEVTDEPGAGGANHAYLVSGMSPENNPSKQSLVAAAADLTGGAVGILFQTGPINDSGTNGLTQEVLLAIVADRLRSFQSGPYKCKENACALTHIEEAQHWLQQRTIARMRRGVEGTHVA